jgi:methyl-accepting chemotaxis protein
MTAIVQGVDGVNALIGEIASATAEQSRAMAEVTAAVGQLDQLTQMNATLVEQKAAAAQALSERVDQLVEAITVFKRMER